METLLKQIKETAGISDTEVLDCIERATEAYAADASKLPKPMSAIGKSGYRHLVRTVAQKRNRSRNELEVGWGKYYGPFLEYGTRKMAARRHLQPLWDAKKDHYYDLIQKEFERRTGFGL